MSETQPVNAEGLLPCPWCGADGYLAEIDGYRPSSPKTYYVMCSDGDCNVQGVEFDSKAEAIEWWNRRRAPQLATQPTAMAMDDEVHETLFHLLMSAREGAEIALDDSSWKNLAARQIKQYDACLQWLKAQREAESQPSPSAGQPQATLSESTIKTAMAALEHHRAWLDEMEAPTKAAWMRSDIKAALAELQLMRPRPQDTEANDEA